LTGLPAVPPVPATPAALSALEALRRDWGSAYLIDYDAAKREWWAARRDQTGSLITAASHEALRPKIRADYAARPVSREVAP
jgi:hypothetical protein